MVLLLKEFQNSPTTITTFTKDMVDNFFNLVHYWPIQIKKDKNVSPNIYKVMTGAKAKDHTTSLDL
jgi:hypothetical protein